MNKKLLLLEKLCCKSGIDAVYSIIIMSEDWKELICVFLYHVSPTKYSSGSILRALWSGGYIKG